MKTRPSKPESGGWFTQSVLDCGGNPALAGATPLSYARWFAKGSQPSSTRKLRRRCALPEQSKTWRRFVASLAFLITTIIAHAQYSIDWSATDGGCPAMAGSTGGAYSVSGIPHCGTSRTRTR